MGSSVLLVIAYLGHNQIPKGHRSFRGYQCDVLGEEESDLRFRHLKGAREDLVVGDREK
jgi:hypothetical protein